MVRAQLYAGQFISQRSVFSRAASNVQSAIECVAPRLGSMIPGPWFTGNVIAGSGQVSRWGRSIDRLRASSNPCEILVILPEEYLQGAQKSVSASCTWDSAS